MAIAIRLRVKCVDIVLKTRTGSPCMNAASMGLPEVSDFHFFQPLYSVGATGDSGGAHSALEFCSGDSSYSHDEQIYFSVAPVLACVTPHDGYVLPDFVLIPAERGTVVVSLCV